MPCTHCVFQGDAARSSVVLSSREGNAFKQKLAQQDRSSKVSESVHKNKEQRKRRLSSSLSHSFPSEGNKVELLRAALFLVVTQNTWLHCI